MSEQPKTDDAGQQALASSHAERIQAQFTQQAETFGKVQAHGATELQTLLLALAKPAPHETALDVACGPGIVTCALAPLVHHITGQDIVKAMLDKARERARSAHFNNVSWIESDAASLPLPSASLDLVITRFSVHHFNTPLDNLRELRRVCKPSGRVVIMDACPKPEHAAGYDAFEAMRDPSHTHALPEATLVALCETAGLHVVERASTYLDVGFEEQLAASFPEQGGVERLRALFETDLTKPFMGLAHVDSTDARVLRYPVSALLAIPASN